jgi:3-hydroxyisobutyrate dehydrogenase-like beta-hydroxyacid dehydrogenase
MEVGFIGLGKMGAGIAKSLLRAGHRLVVYNRTKARSEAFRSHGAAMAISIAEVCRCEIVMTMLSDDAAVEAVTFGEAGILASLKRGAIHASLSTISVALSKRLAAEHELAGQQYVAAPVFGRPEAAEIARLTVVAAGKPEAVQRCRRLFEAMGPKLFVTNESPGVATL